MARLLSGGFNGSTSSFRSISSHHMMFCVSLLTMGVLAGCSTTGTEPQAPSSLGPVQQVPASITADCSVDVTAALQSWIASVPDSSTLMFGKTACYNIDSGLVVTDRHGLTFDGNGSAFKVVSQGTSNRANWTIRAGSGITLRNMIVRGANPHAGSGDSAHVIPLEWQHAFRFQGTQTGTLDNVEAYDVYGDFVEAEPDRRVALPAALPARNIAVRNSHFERNGRQGVGLTHVDGFVFEDNYVGDIALTAIDVEPGDSRAMAKNILIQRNTFGVTRHAILSVGGAGTNESVGGITFSQNVMTARSPTCVPPVFLATPQGVFWSGFVFENNSIKTVGNGFDMLRAKSVAIRNNSIDAVVGPCSSRLSAIVVADSHDGMVSGNTVTKSPATSTAYTIMKVDTLTTGFTVSANSWK